MYLLKEHSMFVLGSTLQETYKKSVHQLIHFVDFDGKIIPGNHHHLETTFTRNKNDEFWKLKKIIFFRKSERTV